MAGGVRRTRQLRYDRGYVQRLIVIGANTQSMFKRLTETMGHPQMADDPRYAEEAQFTSPEAR